MKEVHTTPGPECCCEPFIIQQPPVILPNGLISPSAKVFHRDPVSKLIYQLDGKPLGPCEYLYVCPESQNNQVFLWEQTEDNSC